MCLTIAFIATCVNDTVDIIVSNKTDSHSEIRKEFNVRDDDGVGATRQTPCELIIGGNMLSIEDTEFVFDDTRPEWWTDDMTEIVIRKAWAAWKRRWKTWGKELNFEGDLILNRVISIDSGITLSARNIFLNSLTSIGNGSTLSARNLYLNHVTSIGSGVTLSAGQDLYFDSLTSIDNRVTLSANIVYYRNKWYSIKDFLGLVR